MITPAIIYPQRKIGPFTAQVTISETCVDSLEITQHPVHQGASVTDHAYIKPATVSINFVFGEKNEALQVTYAKLLRLQSDRIPFDLQTGKRAYSNMLLSSITLTTDETTENILSISCDLIQIIFVSSELIQITTKRPKSVSPPETKNKEKTTDASQASKKAQNNKTIKSQDSGSKKALPEPKYDPVINKIYKFGANIIQ